MMNQVRKKKQDNVQPDAWTSKLFIKCKCKTHAFVFIFFVLPFRVEYKIWEVAGFQCVQNRPKQVGPQNNEGLTWIEQLQTIHIYIVYVAFALFNPKKKKKNLLVIY